jgi:hypothetical protein
VELLDSRLAALGGAACAGMRAQVGARGVALRVRMRLLGTPAAGGQARGLSGGRWDDSGRWEGST